MSRTTKKSHRVTRWSYLGNKLREQFISAIKSNDLARAETILKRMNIVRFDNNSRNKTNGFDKPFVLLTFEKAIEQAKSKNLI